jgi:hypothetical protein
MPDELTDERAPERTETADADRVFSGYGFASLVLAVLAAAAVALGVLIWTSHRAEIAERDYQTRVLQTAIDWTNVLVNMNKDGVDSSLQKLHDGTVGQLNADFDTTVEPYRQLVQKLQAQTTGQIDSVSIESIYHAPPGPNGRPAQPPKPQPELSALASRTDTVLVVATSVSQNAGGDKPQTVRWNLRLSVSDVDGKLLISRLEPIR